MSLSQKEIDRLIMVGQKEEARVERMKTTDQLRKDRRAFVQESITNYFLENSGKTLADLRLEAEAQFPKA